MISSNVYLEAFVSELNARYGFKDIDLTPADWVCKQTKLKSSPYSFKDHEFQEKIMNDESQNVVIKKCAQVGLSEVMVRAILAFLARNQSLTAILTQPSRKNALDFSTTRVDDIIKESKLLNSMLDRHVDSKELKKIGKSYLYIKGTIGAKAAISVPADMLIHDELDFSDLDIVNKYSSRIQHSKYKLFRKFSTPTIPNFAISKEFAVSNQQYYMKKCPHCGKYNETSQSFFNDVVVTNDKYRDRPLKTITHDDLAFIKPDEVQYLCQGCRRPISYHEYTKREWVAKYEGRAISGYQVTPFDTAFQTPYNLLKSMNDYTRYADFVNFALGLDFVDTDMIFNLGIIEAVELNPEEAFGLCLGIDFGKVCWLTMGRINPDKTMTVFKAEAWTEDQIKAKVDEYQKKYFVNTLVCDALPQTKLSKDICELFEGPGYTCYYSESQKDLYNIKANEVDITVNRTQLFDRVLGLDKLIIDKKIDQKLLGKHLRGMVKQRDKDDEHKFRYVKVDEDHLLHSLGYLHIACTILINLEGHIAPIDIDSVSIK